MINFSILEGDYLVSSGAVSFESDLPIIKEGQTLLRDVEHRAVGEPKLGSKWNIRINKWEDVRNSDEKAAAKEFETQAARYAGYPSLGDFADAMYWQSKGDNSKLNDYFAKCEAVKQKYPKPNN